MATVYVNKSGNDGNGGTSHADAYLTLSVAYANAGSGGTINIGAGTYTVTSAITTNSDVTVNGDGYVVIDGDLGVIDYLDISDVGTVTHTYNNIIFVDFAGAVFDVATQSGPVIGTFAFNDCEFHNCDVVATAIGGGNTSTTQGTIWQFTRCQFRNITTAVIQARTNPGRVHRHRSEWINNIFYNVGVVHTGDTEPENVEVLKDLGNIYHTVTTIFELSAATDTVADRFTGTTIQYADNFYYSVTNYWDDTSNTHITLSAFKTAVGSGKYGGASQETDPLLTDPTNGFLMPRDDSPTIGAEQIIDRIGPFDVTKVFANAHQSAGAWTIGSSLATDAGTQWIVTSGSITKSGNKFTGTGTLVSPVIDLGATFSLKSFRGVFNETYPTDVIDTDNNDVEPNRKNLEYKISNSSFNQNDSGLSWTTVEFNEALVAISGRYVQVRLVFRSDGAAA